MIYHYNKTTYTAFFTPKLLALLEYLILSDNPHAGGVG